VAQHTEEVIGPFELQDFNLYYISRYGYRPSKVAFLAHHAWGNKDREDPSRIPPAPIYFIQMPEQAAAKFHRLDEAARNLRHSFLLAVDPKAPIHRMEDFRFTAARMKVWIWFEG